MRLMQAIALGVAMSFAVAAPAVAVDKNVAAKPAKLKKTGATGGNATGGGTSALTSQECKGLGGTVNSATPDMRCKAGQSACYTTDKHGVVRGACIDEVASD